MQYDQLNRDGIFANEISGNLDHRYNRAEQHEVQAARPHERVIALAGQQADLPFHRGQMALHGGLCFRRVTGADRLGVILERHLGVNQHLSVLGQVYHGVGLEETTVDTPEAIARRMTIYRQKMYPVLGIFAEAGVRIVHLDAH